MSDEHNEERGEKILFRLVTFLKEYCSGTQVVNMLVYVLNRYVGINIVFPVYCTHFNALVYFVYHSRLFKL